jgi:uncharacterized protein YecE (DUF72 family)
MRLSVGTSGFSYKEWKGSFYPDDLPATEMLRYYSAKLPAVEINNTFYRMPRSSVLESWLEQVGGPFRFVLKASRRITHFKRLNDTVDETDYLFSTAAALGDHLGAVLFQLPPNMKKDAERLSEFLRLIPKGYRAAMEFRHDSWFDDEVLGLLGAHDVALCAAETDEKEAPAKIDTATWGYARLRRTEYDDEQLLAWASRIAEQEWEEAFVFFKHEGAGTGPRLAARFLELVNDA